MKKLTNKVWIYGKHAVNSVLQNNSRKVYKILVSKQNPTILEENLHMRGDTPIHIVSNEEIIKEINNRDAVHQGVAALVGQLMVYNLDELINKSSILEKSFVVAFDQITDPHNVGAIIRTCTAFNVDAVIITKHNCNVDSSVVAKSSSGAIDTIKIIEVANLSNTVETLREKGFWVIGLDSNADKDLSAAKGFNKVILILGAEGDGLRRTTKEHCDLLVKIPISDKINSLNVSNAAAISLYELQKIN